MEMQAMLQKTCPSCGKTVPVPAGLKECSCVYCGTRFHLEEPKPIPASPADADALEALKTDLVACITDHPETLQRLTRKAFTPFFEGYIAQYRPTLDLLPAALRAREDAAHELSVSVVNAVADCCSSSRKLEEAKITLCLVLIPAIRFMNLQGGEEFCQELRSVWLDKFPKHVFHLATYEDICKGFEPRKLCFITTAACTHLGKADDCAELTAFRAFRDGWLSRQPDGQQLIAAYYENAPAIVMLMDFAADSSKVYPTLWAQHLQPCYEALCRGDQEDCRRRYTEMVRMLGKTYLCKELLS